MSDITLHGLFQEASVSFRDKTCVTSIHEKHEFTVTYDEMRCIVNEFRDHWKSVGITTNDFVGIVADELSIEVIAILIGILENGHPFVFIDTSSKSFTDVIRKLDVRYFIAERTAEISKQFCSSFHSTFNTTNSNVHFNIWKGDGQLRSCPLQIPGLAFAVFSSGTTGTPKIIKVPHRCIVTNILDLRKIYHLQPTDTIYLSTPPTFDPCILDLFLALSSGSSLLLMTSSIKFDQHRLSKLFSEKVTILYSTPSLFLKIFPKECDCKSMRILILGGEPFPSLDIETWPVLKNMLIYNVYGVTEVSCWATLGLVVDFKNVSLGKPLTDTILQLRNDDGVIHGDGEGELFIGSERRICIVDNEMNSIQAGPRFRGTGDIVKVCNEKYYFTGRKDRRIKLFGHRVDLSLIDSKTSSFAPVKRCCSVFIPNENRIALFVESYVDDLNLDDLETCLRTELPSFMLPGDIIRVPEIPLNKHGKVCPSLCQGLYARLKRRAVDDTSSEFRRLWMKYTTHALNDRPDEHLGFLQSGGNSMLALQFSEAVAKVYPLAKNLLVALLSDNNYHECLRIVTNDETKSMDSQTSRTSPKLVRSVDCGARGSVHIREIDGNSGNSISKKPKSRTFSESRLLRVNCKGRITAFSQLEDHHEKIAACATVKVKWKQNLEKCVDASPTLLIFADRALVVCGSHAGYLFVIDVRTGKVESKFTLPDRVESSACASPSGELIYVGCYDHNLYCLNVKKKVVEWNFLTNAMVKSTPVYYENRIYFGSYDHNFYCLSSSSGCLLWKVDVDKSSIYATAAIHHQFTIVATLGGTVAFIDHDGFLKHSFSCGSPFFSSPCCLQNDLCVAVDVTGALRLLDVKSGSQLWLHKVHGNVFSSITTINYPNQRLIFGCHDKSVYCFEIHASSGSLLWRSTVDSPVYSTPFYCRCVNPKENLSMFLVTLATTSGNVYILDEQNGTVIKSYSLNQSVFSSPVIFDSNILVGCRDDNLYCLEIS